MTDERGISDMLNNFLKSATEELVKNHNENLGKLVKQLEERHSVRISQLTDMISSEKIRFKEEKNLIGQFKSEFLTSLGGDHCNNNDVKKEGETGKLDIDSYDSNKASDNQSVSISEALEKIEELAETIGRDYAKKSEYGYTNLDLIELNDAIEGKIEKATTELEQRLVSVIEKSISAVSGKATESAFDEVTDSINITHDRA